MATEPLAEHDRLQGPAAWEEEAEREQRPRPRAVAARAAAPAAQQGRARLRVPVRPAGRCRAWPRRCGRSTSPTPRPTENHLSDTIKVDGKNKNVVGLDGVPIGPQWLKADGKFFLGRRPQRPRHHGAAALRRPQLADDRRRRGGDDDAPVDHPRRGRRLLPGLDATPSIRALLDILWSFPVIILGVALGVALALGGLQIGPINDRGRLAR